MKVTINKGKAHGTIVAPPSKSVAHRMLICGGLANAKSTIVGINNRLDEKIDFLFGFIHAVRGIDKEDDLIAVTSRLIATAAV